MVNIEQYKNKGKYWSDGDKQLLLEKSKIMYVKEIQEKYFAK